MRLREALVRSRNLVSIRVMHAIGPAYATKYIERFGFPENTLPRNLTLALGTAQVSPLEMASAYSVFANGGYRVEPYFIQRIDAADGKVVFEAQPRFAVRWRASSPARPEIDVGRRNAARSSRRRRDRAHRRIALGRTATTARRKLVAPQVDLAAERLM